MQLIQFFSDSGDVNDWIQSLVKILPNDSYPLLSIVTNRRPSYINQSLTTKVAFCNIEPLQNDDSSLLFRWWLTSLKVTLQTPIYEAVLEQISGSPKLIETAARLLRNIPDPNDMRVVKQRIFADLEQSASRLLTHGATGDLSKIILALIVDCGHISKTDLLSVVSKVMNVDLSAVTECHNKLQSYGLVQADSICVKVPNYLTRTAKSFGRDADLLAALSLCWRALGENMVDLQLDEETSISILNDACLVQLKLGVNSVLGIESLILPSQCLRAARQLYDNKEYVRAYDLCFRAYQGRLALTVDGAIEALRFRGMAAARLNDSQKLNDTLSLFGEYKSNSRALRISEFIRGFDCRLAGKFDLALNHMLQALKFRGEQDIHILRELAFLYLANNDSKNAKLYVEKAIDKARNNSFILELKILVELSFGKGYVIHNQHVIESLIEILENISSPGSKGYAFRARVNYLIAKGEVAEARDEFEKQRGFSQGQSIVQKLLEAKLLLAENKFQAAYNILLPTKKELLDSRGFQRRSLLPLLSDMLIQAAAGISLSKAVSEFALNAKYLTEAISEKTRKELLNMAAYSREKISPEERRVLGA